ncbi:MAG: asparagine synthase-related protein [Saprospiraceae bacterium]
MSRWLAITDRKGRLKPEEGEGAFQVYPWFRPENLQVVRREPRLWMGLAAPDGLPSASGRLLWDGAIYNLQDLEHPDEQACLESAYRVGGGGALCQWNGRWSFLLADELAGRLWMARDRTGVKPLYYWTDGERAAFASEPKLLLSLPFVDRGFDPAALFDYFVLSQADTNRNTLFRGIRQVLQGHELNYDLETGRLTEKPYFSPEVNPECGVFEPEKAKILLASVRGELEKAVSRRLAYHAVPPATLLSGGLDSSTMAALIRQESAAPLTALTAAYREEAFGEQEWAGQMAEHLGARWLQVFPTIEGLKEDLEDFIFSQDTPTFSAGTYSQYCLFRMARQEGIPVLFDGQGADAMFAGHLPHLPPLWRDLLLSGQWKALSAEWEAFGPVWKSWSYWASYWLKYEGIPRLPGGMQHLFKRWYFPELRYLNPDILESQKNRYMPGDWTPPFKASPRTLNNALGEGYFGGPLSFLLKCVDRASSWAGVETCTPYSDDAALMDAVFQIPGAYKIRNGVRKWLLRESCAGLLPPAISGRKDKMGLVTPNNAWMAQLRPLVRTYLEEQDDAVFNKKLLLKEFDRFFNPPGSLENFRVYKYLSLIVWRGVFRI